MRPVRHGDGVKDHARVDVIMDHRPVVAGDRQLERGIKLEIVSVEVAHLERLTARCELDQRLVQIEKVVRGGDGGGCKVAHLDPQLASSSLQALARWPTGFW